MEKLMADKSQPKFILQNQIITLFTNVDIQMEHAVIKQESNKPLK